MKKQLKKLNLNKRTVSNLNAAEMKLKVGGDRTQGGRKCQAPSFAPRCNTGPDPSFDSIC